MEEQRTRAIHLIEEKTGHNIADLYAPDYSEAVDEKTLHVGGWNIRILKFANLHTITVLLSQYDLPDYHARYQYDPTAPTFYGYEIYPNITIQETYAHNVLHGKRVTNQTFPHGQRIQYYDYGKLHRADGPASYYADVNGNYNTDTAEFWVYGEKAEPFAVYNEIVTSTNPRFLTGIVTLDKFDPLSKFFAAHNPYCPDEVKVEYNLLPTFTS